MTKHFVPCTLYHKSNCHNKQNNLLDAGTHFEEIHRPGGRRRGGDDDGETRPRLRLLASISNEPRLHVSDQEQVHMHGRMARGGHGLLKSPGPAMPDPSTPCRRATPEMAEPLQPFQGWPARRMGSLRPSSTLLDTPRRTPMST
jgi:hypothetical protein